MGRQAASWFFGGVWNVTARIRPYAVPTRELNAAVKAIGFEAGVGRKPNMRLLFDLARWGMTVGELPRKSLAKFREDLELFDVLKLNGEIRQRDAFFLGDLSPAELLRLEKRLHHQWGSVQKIVDALIAPRVLLRNANAKRRNLAMVEKNMKKSMVSTLLGV